MIEDYRGDAEDAEERGANEINALPSVNLHVLYDSAFFPSIETILKITVRGYRLLRPHQQSGPNLIPHSS